jgi:hypothetical protein
MDVSDIVEYNAALLNHNDLSNSFFCLSKGDPTSGFAFDASKIAGSAFPDASIDSLGKPTCGCYIRCGVAARAQCRLPARDKADGCVSRRPRLTLHVVSIDKRSATGACVYFVVGQTCPEMKQRATCTGFATLT